jgi:hypothetical protein
MMLPTLQRTVPDLRQHQPTRVRAISHHHDHHHRIRQRSLNLRIGPIYGNSAGRRTRQRHCTRIRPIRSAVGGGLRRQGVVDAAVHLHRVGAVLLPQLHRVSAALCMHRVGVSAGAGVRDTAMPLALDGPRTRAILGARGLAADSPICAYV